MLKGSKLDTRIANHLKDFGIEEQAGSTPGKGCADATFTLKTALQTLREHDNNFNLLLATLSYNVPVKNHGYYLLISLKLTIQSTEKCYGRFSRLLEYQKA
jgi:hypothetical protein